LKWPPSFIANPTVRNLSTTSARRSTAAQQWPRGEDLHLRRAGRRPERDRAFDWATFLHTRLDSTAPEAPTGGIENGGWKVTFSGEPAKLSGRRGTPTDAYSIGLQLGGDGSVSDSIVGSPAFEAGISSGMKVIGVNGRVYTHDLLEDAIKAAKDSSQPITLLVVSDDYINTSTIHFNGGSALSAPGSRRREAGLSG
jgi:predicted metalloprotease with PDZ domain